MITAESMRRTTQEALSKYLTKMATVANEGYYSYAFSTILPEWIKKELTNNGYKVYDTEVDDRHVTTVSLE